MFTNICTWYVYFYIWVLQKHRGETGRSLVYFCIKEGEKDWLFPQFKSAHQSSVINTCSRRSTELLRERRQITAHLCVNVTTKLYLNYSITATICVHSELKTSHINQNSSTSETPKTSNSLIPVSHCTDLPNNPSPELHLFWFCCCMWSCNLKQSCIHFAEFSYKTAEELNFPPSTSQKINK